MGEGPGGGRPLPEVGVRGCHPRENVEILHQKMAHFNAILDTVYCLLNTVELIVKSGQVRFCFIDKLRRGRRRISRRNLKQCGEVRGK